MKNQFNKALGLSLMLCLAPTITTAAAVKETTNKVSSSEKQSSLIVKALDQQKRSQKSFFQDDDELKMINTIKTKPSQNFLAAQHERFSRFVQAIFQPHNS